MMKDSEIQIIASNGGHKVYELGCGFFIKDGIVLAELLNEWDGENEQFEAGGAEKVVAFKKPLELAKFLPFLSDINAEFFRDDKGEDILDQVPAADCVVYSRKYGFVITEYYPDENISHMSTEYLTALFQVARLQKVELPIQEVKLKSDKFRPDDQRGGDEARGGR